MRSCRCSGCRPVREDDAYRALRAAWELRGAIESLNQQLEPRIGIRLAARMGVNTGEVVTAHAGTLALGDAINVAARLEQLADLTRSFALTTHPNSTFCSVT